MATESPTDRTADRSQEGVGEALTFSSAPPPEREALLRAILETSPDGLITIDEDGIIQSFNPAAERMFGYQAIEVIGRNVSYLMPSLIAKSTAATWSASGALARSGSSALGARCWANAATVLSFPWSSRSARFRRQGADYSRGS
jgi:PAS domain-containing protein